MKHSAHLNSARNLPRSLVERQDRISASKRNHPSAKGSSVVDEVQVDLEESLTKVATLAVRAIPGADGAGVTLLEGDHVDTIVASGNFVRLIDAIQYNAGQGPCVTAATEGRTVCTGGLSQDRNWPTFSRRTRHLGVESVLSLPLLSEGRELGTINVYAYARDAFDTPTIEMGEQFAEPAATLINRAQLLARFRRIESRR